MKVTGLSRNVTLISAAVAFLALSCCLSCMAEEKEGEEKKKDDVIAKSLDSCCNRYLRGPNIENDPIDYATGELVLKNVDFHETSPKLDFSLVRTYRSHLMPDGSFGPGWAFTLDSRLKESDDGLLFQEGNGSLIAADVEGTSDRNAVGKKRSGVFVRRSESEGFGYEAVTKDGHRWLFTSRGLLSEVRASDAATRIERNDSGAIEKVTDPRGHIFTFSNDDAGHITRIEVKEKYVWTFSYDEHGNLTRAKNPLGDYYTYAYIAAEGSGRQRMFPSAVGLSGKPLYTLHYDREGRVTKRSWDKGENTITYDEAGGTTAVKRKDGSQLTYEYTGTRR